MVDLIVPVCQGRSSDNYYTSAPASCWQIASAAKPLGVVLYDHIIVGEDGHANVFQGARSRGDSRRRRRQRKVVG
jgi:hypothetical protein